MSFQQKKERKGEREKKNKSWNSLMMGRQG